MPDGITQDDQKRILQKRIGDWFLFHQPVGKMFTGTHQRHSRGIWTEAERIAILKSVTGLDEDALAVSWRKNGMSWLTESLPEVQAKVRSAQNHREPVTPVINSLVESRFPGRAQFSTLLSDDRIVNRGNAHMDCRFMAPSEDYLNGWTLDTPGSIVHLLKSGKVSELGRNKLAEYGARIEIPGIGRVEVDRINCNKKSPQPTGWLTIVTKDDPVFEAKPGEVGATPDTSGRFDWFTGGEPWKKTNRHEYGLSVVYGIRRSNFHEQFHFYGDPELQFSLGGRWTFRLLEVGGTERAPEALTWLMRRDDDPVPFIMKNDWKAEVAQAKSEKTDMIWNLSAIPTLRKYGYFRMHGIEKEYAEFMKSERSAPPPDDGVAKFYPTGPVASLPDIFGKSISD